MRGGHNKKSLEEHIINGTYRSDRHGIKPEEESIVLQKMKQSLWELFTETKKELKRTTIDNEADKYKNLHSLLMEQIKVFNSLVRNPVGKSTDKDKKQDKIDIHEFKTL